MDGRMVFSVFMVVVERHGCCHMPHLKLTAPVTEFWLPEYAVHGSFSFLGRQWHTTVIVVVDYECHGQVGTPNQWQNNLEEMLQTIT